MSQARVFYVAWRSREARAIYPVGRLVQQRESPRFEFAYIQGAREAHAQGFALLPGFPDEARVYRGDELFPLFSNRLMPTSRPDFSDYVTRLGLDPKQVDSMSLLARSAGLRLTDQLEFIELPQRDPHSGAIVYFFLVRGVRYMPGAEERIARLAPGERLRWMLDRQNTFDPRAIVLRTDDNYLVGYVPHYLVDDATQLIAVGDDIQVRVERVNLPPAPIHHRLLCRLQGHALERFVPFASPRYQPISQDATRLTWPDDLLAAA